MNRKFSHNHWATQQFNWFDLVTKWNKVSCLNGGFHDSAHVPVHESKYFFFACACCS